ncbi:MAG TPA: amino acid adenylation domain-containing protein [Gaiellaceae bacterium]|nr:amino acid adenylation domain-containing protein [Gaiellaceae bacterium]
MTDLRERPPDRTAAPGSSAPPGSADVTRIGYAAKADASAGGMQPPSVDRVDRTGQIRCSFAQEQFWFVDQLRPGNLAYNFSWPVRLRGQLDRSALERALGELVARHEALRTGFATEDAGPVQVIAPGDGFSLDAADVSGETDPEAAARRLIDEETGRRFDLRRPGLFRARLLRLADDDHILHLVVHHIVFDEWSKVVLYRELAALYEAYANGRPSPLREPAIQYADFAEWQRSVLTDEALEEHLAYWSKELAGVPAALVLPTDRPRPSMATLLGARRRLPLPSHLTSALDRLAAAEGASFFDAVLATLEVLLYRYTREDDFVVGVPADNRIPEFDGTVGVLLNTVVVRSDVQGIPSFRTLVHRVRQRVQAAAQHADLPFERLVQRLRPERDPSRHPLFQVLLAINPPDPSLVLPGLESEAIETETAAAGVDLFMFLQEREGGYDALWEYSTDLFDRETVERMHGHFVRLLASAIAAPDTPLDELPLLTESERHRLTVDWQGPDATYPETALHRLVEAQAESSPAAVAVSYDGEEMSYGELNARANQLARRLRAAGVAQDSLVAVGLERSPDLIVALLGILKAGGAYVPLDPGLPGDRLAFMLEDSGADVLVTAEHVRRSFPPFSGLVISVDGNRTEIAAEDDRNLEVPVDADHLAYVIYTSGSTGRPKGVLNTHRGIVNRLQSMQETYRLGPSDRLLQKTQISFDVAVREVFWPLLFGARIVVARPGEHGNPTYLADLIEREQVTTLHFVPSMLQLFLDQVDAARCSTLRCVLCGGETLPGDLVQRFFERFDCGLHNLYGPSEAAVSVTAWPCERGAVPVVVPIGRPVANTQVYAVDARLEPVPVGVWGELCIGGVQLARGYHRRPELTAERFVANPFGPGRLYRTGDLGRWTTDGALEFGGRVDSQVKLRGFRIELGEIEAVLREHDTVADSVVIAVETAAGHELAAYVVLDSDGPGAPDLQAFARSKLPDYMVPAFITAIPQLPLLPSGKLDRNALPAPERAVGNVEMFEPEGELERAVAAVWTELLGVERVGRDQNFFAAGGHSLLAARLVGRVGRNHQVEVALGAFMQEPTVAALAREVASAERAAEPRLPPLVAKRGVRECSFAQERFLFIDQVMGASSAYNIPTALRVRGDLQLPALEMALTEIVRRHEILRTRFGEEDGRPVQLVVPAHPVTLPVVDLAGLPDAERAAEAKRFADAQTQAAFDPTTGPLFRAHVLRLEAREHILHLVFSHLVFDGWSKVVMFRELESLYNASVRRGRSGLHEPGVQYGDFAEWQRSWLGGELLERELAHWRTALDGVPAALELPTDNPRPPVATLRGAWLRSSIPSDTVARLQELARSEGVTPYMVLLAAFDVLLARYTGQDDIVVGMPVDGRDQAELDDAIGVFVDTVVLRIDLSGEITFRQALDRVRSRMLDAIAHQRLPFERLVRALEPERLLGRHPLYQVMLTLVPPALSPGFAGLDVDEIPTERATSPIDLTVFIEPRGDALEAVWEYSTDLFDQTTVERLQQHFARVLEAAVSSPDTLIAELPLLTDQERERALEAWSRAGAEYPVACLHDLFERRAREDPDAPAVTYEGRTISYGELNARANRLAHRLRTLGVGPESMVGLCLRRSLDLAVAILATLKAGGAYVPLDPDYPGDRIAFVLSDTGAPVLLTQSDLLDRLPAHDAVVLCVDRDARTLEQESSENPEPLTTAESLAYVIYTSGSTGTPKGVQVEHRHVARLFTATDEWFDFGAGDTWLLFHSYAFDFSVWELWGALLYGGRLVIPPLWTTRSPEALAGLLVDENVTVLNATPSLFVGAQTALLEAAPDLSLRLVIFGGEALQPSALRPWFEHFGSDGPTLVNMYGITETTVHVTYRPLTSDDCERDTSPIGRPIPDLQLFVLDSHLEPVPAGAPGELYVGGAGVSRGYLNRPELTAERFVANPFGVGHLYRTGDSARYRADGEIEYLGRIDDQVKIRGFRIELGEIQAALAAHSSVRECAVVAHQVEPGDTRLAAYVVPAGIRDGSAADDHLRFELRDHLERRLPAFMIPASLTLLDALPLTTNGKLDRKALPAPAWEEQTGADFVAPRTAIEIHVADVWREILGVERVGVGDNFFHIGGHSLLAARVVTRVREHFSIDLSVRALFERPTLSAFAEQVAAAAETATPTADAPADEAPTAVYPPSFSQQQLLFIDRLAPDVATYNGALGVRIDGALDRAALERALAGVVERHEALRTVFRWDDDGAVQVVLDDWRLELPLVVVTDEAELHELLREEAHRPFDLARDLMVRMTLYQLGPEEHVLVVMTHHIASDGWSVGVFCRDLGELYDAYRSGRRPRLPDLPLQYRDFAIWQRERLAGERLAAELAYWRGELAGAPTVLPLPTDGPRPPRLTFDGAIVELSLPPEFAAGVLDLCRTADVTPYMLLLAVFGVLLYRRTGQDDILVSGPFANRGRADFDGLVGFFANTLVVRVRMEGNPRFSELLGRVRAAALGAFEHQEVPFEHIVDAVRPQRDPGVNPLAQVNFRVRVDPPVKPELTGTTTSRVPVDIGFAAFDLALDLDVLDDGVRGELLYNTHLFERETVNGMADDFVQLLRQLLVQPQTRLLALELPSETAVSVDPAPRASIRRFREASGPDR